MHKFITYFANRLREPTTWAGIILTLQEAGVMLSPDSVELIRTVGLSIAAAVVMFMKEGRADD